MAVKKILSIDFDIIMYPCIKLYNNNINSAESDVVLWNNLSHELNIDNFLCYDANALKALMLLVRRGHFNKSKIIPIKEHHFLVDNLKAAEDYDNTTYDIVNIDFHHDIHYHPDSKNLCSTFDKYTCADWLGYLKIKGKLNSATWVKAPNSDLPVPDCKEALNTTLNINTDIQSIMDEKFDEIYICLSPHWVPYKYHHLYDLLMITGGLYDEHYDECE